MLTLKKYGLYGIFIALLLGLMNPVAWGTGTSGGGGYPGANCTTEGTAGTYQPAPYVGQITISIDEESGNIFAEGSITQKGTTNVGTFLSGVSLATLDNPADFSDLRPNDLRGACVVNSEVSFWTIINGTSTEIGWGFFELVGIGGLVYNAGTNTYSAQVVVMHVIIE